ncbi:MAG TPA: DoxX family membrane protein [Terracidiphilus sp.]|nr:DoxX family membrane protein [Terracidiphilus sp.]
MAPLIALLVSFVVFFLAGHLGVTAFRDAGFALRCALAVMFVLTASAHWGKRRADLIRMVPPAFPDPGLLVTISGALELLGAIGLLISATARAACICLAVMLIALFPANVHAAREHLTIGGRPVPGLPLRAAIQIVFLAALIAAASHR